MKLRYIVDIDIDIEDIEMEFQLRDDIKDFVKNHEYGYTANSVDVKLQDEYCIKEELKLLNVGNKVLKRGELMGYISNEDDTFTKVGHKKNKMKNKQKHKRIRKIKKNSKCKNRS